MTIEWTPYLAVGISKVDDRHIELFTRFNRLLDAIDQGDGKQELENLTKFLDNYAASRFAEEETAMDRYGYPDAGYHKAQHEAFLKDYRSIKNRIRPTDKVGTTAPELLKHVAQWLTNHVARTDQEFGQFLRVAMSLRKAA